MDEHKDKVTRVHEYRINNHNEELHDDRLQW